jgi:hypothetical protein
MSEHKDALHTGLGPQDGKITENADDPNLSILNKKQGDARLNKDEPSEETVPRKSSFSGNE